MTEEEGVHRRQCERTLLDAEIRDQADELNCHKRGQIFAFLLAMFGIGGSMYILATIPTVGGAVGGTVVGGGSLVALIVAFLRRKSEPEKAPPETRSNNRKSPEKKTRKK